MIRMIEEKDIPLCLGIYNWYIANSTATFETEELTLEEFSGRVHNIREKFPWIVYEENDEILGYAYLSSFNTRAAYDWTCDLAVYLDHEARGKGIGSILMKEIISLAEKDGYVSMVSLVTEGNTASEHLHEKFGFMKAGVMHKVGYKNGWLGVTFYERKLNPAEDNPSEILNVNPYGN